MFTGGGGASTWEDLIEHYEIGYLIDLGQKPVGKNATAAAGNLPTQQLDGTVENPVVVRFYHSLLAMIDKANHSCIFNRRPGQRMRLQQHSSSFCPDSDAAGKRRALFSKRNTPGTSRQTQLSLKLLY